ncbi:MAG: hypothetical protein KDK76_01325 [Chlamydiia bacterium]|nr:hypothetical protein [Chlamydiia bacterium]
MDILTNTTGINTTQTQPAQVDVNTTCREIVHAVEKVSALCRLLGIDPSIYLEKGKLPSLEECAVLLEVVNQTPSENDDLKLMARGLVGELQQLISSLPPHGDYTQVYKETYTTIKESKALSHLEFATSFFAHAFFQLFAGSYASKAMTPFFTTRINEQIDGAFHYNTNSTEQIMSQEAFLEPEGIHLSPIDQLVYGIFMMALLQSSTFVLGSKELSIALSALFSTPQIIEEVTSSSFFKDFKNYILEAAPQFFEEQLKNEVYKRELSKLRQKGGINTLNAFTKNPGKEAESVVQLAQTFITNSVQETYQGAKKVGEASVSFFQKSARNLGSLFSSGVAETASRQLEIGSELVAEASEKKKQVETGVQEHYQIAQGKSEQLMSHYELLMSSYSPRWELYKNILPNELLFLALANSNSSNEELFVRATMTGAMILSGRRDIFPMAGIVLLSSLIQKFSKKFGQNRSIMNSINKELSKYGQEVRHFLENQKSQINHLLQENLGLSPNQSKEVMKTLKELLFASPMILLSLLSNESYMLSWLMYYNPLENLVSDQAKKWGYADQSEVDGKSSISSIVHNTLLYNLIVGALLMTTSSPFYANMGAILSQMPSIKDPATKWINEKAAPLVRKGVQTYAPEWVERYDQAVQAYSTYTWATQLLGKAAYCASIIQNSPFFSSYIPTLNPSKLKDQLIAQGKDYLTAVGGQMTSLAGKYIGMTYLKEGKEFVASYIPESVSTNAKDIASKTAGLFYNALLASMLYYSLPNLPRSTEFPLIEDSLEESLKGALSIVLATPPSQNPDPTERKNTLVYLAGIAFILHLTAAMLSFSNEPILPTESPSNQFGLTSFMMTYFLSAFAMKALSIFG